jgi:thiol:disulfide interchange protein
MPAFSDRRVVTYLQFAFALVLALCCCGPQARADSAKTGAAHPTQSADTPDPSVKAPHLTVGLVPLRDSIQPGGDLDVGLAFHLDKGWHVYWTNAGDAGEPPRIRWTLPQGFTATGLQFPVPKRIAIGPLMDFGYEDEVMFPTSLHADATVKAPSSAEATAKVDWLVCREACFPGKAELKLPLQVRAEATPERTVAKALFDIFRAKLPRPLPSGDQAKYAPTQSGFALAVLTGKKESNAQFFPLDQNVIANAKPQPVKPLSNGFEIDLARDENLKGNPPELHGIVVAGDGTAYEIHAAQGVVPAAHTSAGIGRVLKIAALAFVGGMILNLMPCVFPVLFLKGLALVQSSGDERHRMRIHGGVYTAGIVASFWLVVALLLVLRAGGRQFGWGFQFQSPSFIALMALLLFFLGLSLGGMFEIGLTLTSAGGSLATKGGYAGSFFTGVLAMVVATPCTAPFMGAAIGFALSESAVVTFVIFTALALGLAAPYLLLSFNPAWTRLLPRPGAWMEVLKQATAVPIFATVIWLVWLFAMSAGSNALVGLLGAFLLLGVAGWILGRWPAKRVPTLVAAVVLLLAIALPVYAARHFGAVSTASRGSTAGAVQWEPFTPELVEKYRAQGKPVFVDFTASWCLSCQVNERVVLDRADVQDRLRTSGVALIRADWTRHDDVIAQALEKLGRSGVPTYALYPAAQDAPPELLPEVLTPGIVLDALTALGTQKTAQTPTAAAQTE